jgi:endoglucanase Acf2
MRAAARRMSAASPAVPVTAVLLTAVLLTASACTTAPGGESPPGAARAGPITEGASDTTLAAPKLAGGAGNVAPATPAGSSPTKTPAQAGKALVGQALPTNQWWTSALTGPRTQPIWAHPLTVQAGETGMQLSSAPPKATANSVVTPFVPALTAGGSVSGVRVTGYGAFHVVLEADQAGGGIVETTLVQGSPVLYQRFRGTTPVVTVTGAGPTAQLDGAVAHVEAAGQRWDLLAGKGGTWQQDGKRLTAKGAADGRIAVARVPDRVDGPQWIKAIAGSADRPVTRTTARMAYDAGTGTVTQTLAVEGGSGVFALMPHQGAGLVPGPKALAGTYPEALGPLSLVRADTVRVHVPMPGLLTAAPSVPLSAAARGAVVADLDKDLADPPGTGGSYFGLKELGRLATIADVAGAVGADAQRKAALDRLRPQLVDWLTYSGPSDGHYFAYDKTWGGLIAVPAEFGSNDYNDHHFQYGYLVRAAAVLGAADPAFVRDYGATVDLVARDYSGALAGKGAHGFPPFRSFNPYSGHSMASGFAPFADGNNQESSSEAVAAWEALARWGTVRGNTELANSGIAHYAMEAATARMYWLGEGLARPAGYAHTTTGMVWDAKIDYATFFDGKPESVQGIQLLPLTFGSLYRADPKAAAARSAEITKAAGGAPRAWGDLFTADLALSDPNAARQRLGGNLPREESTSRAMVRYWVELLATYGPPQPGVAADGPFGLAFGSRDNPVLVGVNPTGKVRTVTFRTDGKVAGRLDVGAGKATTQR